ncbi:AraC family transcriptional regulator [Luteolibacter sp. LG18]|uniref:AraC family transcriptional regulator n=1 Tax=Luteolibacter sp. LG18 TaxID=2819286 RepID=UPI0030C770CD
MYSTLQRPLFGMDHMEVPSKTIPPELLQLLADNLPREMFTTDGSLDFSKVEKRDFWGRMDRNQDLASEGLNALEESIVRPFVVMAKIAEYLRRNYRTPLGLTAIADQFGMKPVRLRRSFKKIFKMAPLEYLMNVRIENAKKLLASTTKGINDVAVEVGFYDHSALTKQFLKITGENPSAYRSKKREEIFDMLVKFG